jgi:membrane-bound ClpP family serine protease
MSVGLVIAVIIVGLILVLLEILVIPGVGVAGILGGMLIIGGVVLAYTKSVNFGHSMLAFSAVLTGVSFYYSMRAKTWNKVALNESLEGKVNVIEKDSVKQGDIGTSISRLAPIGIAEINNKEFEVESIDGFINEHSTIEVVNIQGNKIIVKQKQS